MPLAFGVPLEDIFPKNEIHPAIQVLFINTPFFLYLPKHVTLKDLFTKALITAVRCKQPIKTILG